VYSENQLNVWMYECKCMYDCMLVKDVMYEISRQNNNNYYLHKNSLSTLDKG